MNALINRRIGTAIVCGLISSFGFCFMTLGVTSGTLATANYQIVKKIPLGGEGRWDYLTLDSVARRLYITRSTRVTVLNVDTGLVVGEIPGTASNLVQNQVASQLINSIGACSLVVETK